MGWRISNIDNEPVLSKEQAIALVSNLDFINTVSWDYYDSVEDAVTSAGSIEELAEGCLDFDRLSGQYSLYFDEDAMEHMDYLGRDKGLLQLLDSLGISGDITFGSLDGDNSGQFWGYRFYGGKEPYRLLQGEIAFHAVDPSEV